MPYEIHDHISYDLARVYYVMHATTGVTECDGPFTERQAYELADRCRDGWTILQLHDEKEN